jgi:tetratricopeptide (TPR) repeat protein
MFRRARAGLWVVVAAAWLGAAARGATPAAAPPSADKPAVAAARKAARRAFKAKQYATACALYQKIVAQLPDDPPSRADLALCLQRLGRKADAIAANYQALALAARTDRAPDGDPATRRHAYHNLSTLDVAVDLPSAKCGPLPAAPGCAKHLWVCQQKGEARGARAGTTWNIARIGTSADEADFEPDERVNPDTGPGSNEFQRRAASADLVLEKQFESYFLDGDDSFPTEHTDCGVVVADACLGLIGLACTQWTDGNDDETSSVLEAYVTPVK